MPAKKTSKGSAKVSQSEFEAKVDEIVDKISTAIKENKSCHCSHKSGGSAIYGMGIVGALIYYFQHPPVGEWLLTIFKIIFWPAVVAYRLLETFGL